MSAERKNYWSFTPAKRQYARDRANGHCEIFYPYCQRPNTGQVNHTIGSYEGRMAGVPREVIQDVKLNSYLGCELHIVWQESYEKRNIETIIYERKHKRKHR